MEKSIYLLCPYGLGDTMLVSGYREALQDKLNLKVVLIIKRSHQSIMRMYGIDEYIIYDFTKDEIQAIENRKDWPDIEGGIITISRPGYFGKDGLFESFINNELPFRDMYRKYFGLDTICNFQLPMSFPSITQELREKLPAAIEEIVLVMPEMNAPDVDTVPNCFFKKIIEQRIEEIGEKRVVVNTINNAFGEKGLHIDLTLDELIALASKCKEVISARSGICDLIFQNVNNLTVIYPNNYFYELYSLRKMFGNNIHSVNVHEKTIRLDTFFRENTLNECAIYGMGFAGKRIAMCLEKENIKIKFVIDRNKNIDSRYKLYQPEDKWPDVPVVIVTPVKDRDSIVKIVEDKLDAKIIFYKDLMMMSSYE